MCIMQYRSWLACRRISHIEKQHAAAVINGHGVINKEEGKHGDAYQRTTTTRQRGGDGDGEGRREKYNLLHEGFFKLGALHTVVLVCFAQGVGRYI